MWPPNIASPKKWGFNMTLKKRWWFTIQEIVGENKKMGWFCNHQKIQYLKW